MMAMLITQRVTLENDDLESTSYVAAPTQVKGSVVNSGTSFMTE